MVPAIRTRSSNPVQRLGYGEFFGSFAWKRDLRTFSLAYVAPDTRWTVERGIRHTHTDTHLIFTFGGNYVLSSGNRERVLPSKSAIFVPAGTTHQNYPQSPRTHILAVSVSEPQIEQVRQVIRLPETESDFQYGAITFLASRLRVEGADWDDASAIIANGLCLEIMGALSRREKMAERRPPRWLGTAREMLHDGCAESIRIAEVALACGVHPIHLCRTFRKFFHCSPGEYLRSCRLERAAVLLRKGDLPMARIALDCGFSDQSQMCKAFRRRFGTTPARFSAGSGNVSF
jgi:AraC family transcriptional regulator